MAFFSLYGFKMATLNNQKIKKSRTKKTSFPRTGCNVARLHQIFNKHTQMLSENPAGLDDSFETIKNSVPLYLPVAQPVNKIATDALHVLVLFIEQAAETYAQQAINQSTSKLITSDSLHLIDLL